MFWQNQAKKEPPITVEFIKAVTKMADKVKAEAPFIELQREQEMREIRRQTFLDEARKVFTEAQALFMYEYIAKMIY